ncbi:hypothetical protein CkaCkLH20_08929 [Colletotrichum karsti]|uniref:Uncharacterized protein n=1 Tax=Colletotrichum karsti TaxID=1095194 RepID=A0A9P6I0B5_9PEZI|nr:uncharacterized protein CkaCkLH20_08929 [Colletotrichum karsti]KAF9873470.1 hypothetical protein CkaCkLH20_08929 [Colletotrichum karsti]
MPTTSSKSSEEGPSIAPSSTTETLPREIVLLILEAFVADIVENTLPIAFMVHNNYPNEETGSKFSIQVEHPAAERKQDSRWSEIQTPLHINQHTRALTQEHFFSYPMFYRSDVTQGWVCPRWDRFNFYIGDAEKMILEEERNGLYLEKHPDRGRISQLQEAIENPAPFDVQLVQGMQVLHNYPSDMFASLDCEPDVELAFSLPNLREIHIDLGATGVGKGTVKRPREPHSHDVPHRIDAAIYPELASRGYDRGEVFDICARKAQERGVRIVCLAQYPGSGYWETLELLRTPEGIRMKFVHPECICYGPNPSND